MASDDAAGLSGRYLPRHDFSERHSIVIKAPAARVLDAARAYDPEQDRLIRTLIVLREMPDRLLARFGFQSRLLGFQSRLGARKTFGMSDFTLLGRDGDRELAYGLAGQFWRSDYGLANCAGPDDFAAYQPPRSAKLVLNFVAEARRHETLLTTRTRVHCTDAVARRRFLPYWLLIRPVSGFIRGRVLRAIKRMAEA